MKDPNPKSLILYSVAAMLALGGVARYLWIERLESSTYSALAPWMFACGLLTWVWAYREHRRGPKPRPSSD